MERLKYFLYIAGIVLLNSCENNKKQKETYEINSVINGYTEQDIIDLRKKLDVRHFKVDTSLREFTSNLRNYYFTFDTYGRVSNCKNDKAIVEFNIKVIKYNNLLDSIGINELEFVEQVADCPELQEGRKENLLKTLFNEQIIIDSILNS